MGPHIITIHMKNKCAWHNNRKLGPLAGLGNQQLSKDMTCNSSHVQPHNISLVEVVVDSLAEGLLDQAEGLNDPTVQQTSQQPRQ